MDEGSLQALQSELEQLTVKELRLRAAEEGVLADAIEDARDSDTPKVSLIQLILASSQAPAAPGEEDTAATAMELLAAAGEPVPGWW